MELTNVEHAKLMQETSLVTIFGYSINIYGLIILALVLLFMWAVFRANDDPNTDFDWLDLVTAPDPNTGINRASATKMLQLVGGITGTFIVVKLTLQNNISFEIFAAYLTYVASIEGFSKFMLAKYGVRGEDRTHAVSDRKKSRHYSDGDHHDHYPPPPPRRRADTDGNDGPMPRPRDIDD